MKMHTCSAQCTLHDQVYHRHCCGGQPNQLHRRRRAGGTPWHLLSGSHQQQHRQGTAAVISCVISCVIAVRLYPQLFASIDRLHVRPRQIASVSFCSSMNISMRRFMRCLACTSGVWCKQTEDFNTSLTDNVQCGI